jgi:3-dehydroquinate synthase
VRKLQITTRVGEYSVSVGSGILSSLSKRTVALAANPRQLVFLLTSPEIWSLWGERVETALSPRTPVVLFLAPGERHKRMAQVERLATEMAKAGADRSSVLIAFGGGVIGDMGGFLAAIYMRGIDYIQVPTTLLAQVDSSVGGKVAANLQTGKNLVGCFYPPQAVIADISLLHTLPHRELRAGIYESIKAGLIRDAALFRYIEAQREEIDRGEPAALEKMVAASIQVKAEVVALDERELGLRMILNFGHTIGHAIEAATSYRALLHGEAIAWGMLIALEVSRARSLVKADAVRRVQNLLNFFTPPPFPAVSTKRLLQAASGDKKNRAGVRRFVLLEGIGNAVVVEDVTDGELVAAIDVVRSQ